MKRFFNWVVRLFSYRRSWVRQITVAATKPPLKTKLSPTTQAVADAK